MNTPADLSTEQDHYDTSLETREAHRQSLKKAPESAARPQDAREIRKAMDGIQASLPEPHEPAFFGRIDVEHGGATRTLYLGAMSVLDEDKRPLVINFNAPAAACYYKATPANPMNMIRKRTYEVEAHRLTDYEQVVLKELEKDVEALEKALQGPEDSLLRDLESSRDGNMRHIARTIGAAQYDVISHPLDRLLVVQGGPGTGKTAVALHRVSYWLYNSQSAADPADRLDPSDVLLVGPSQAFTKYISRVLPGLGDGDIAYRHLRNLGPQPSDSRSEPVELAKLKGDARMALLLARALRGRIRVPDEPLGFGPAGGRMTVGVTAIQTRINQLADLPYRAGREQFRIWLNEEALLQSRRFSADMINAAVERVWPLPTAQRFLQELLASQNMLLAAAGDDFSAGEIRSLQRQAATRISEETWSDADVALIDEVEALMDGRPPTFKHLVVDEAQDLSHMQLRSLRRRSANGSMTIVGDLAQSTGPHARDSWDDIVWALEQGNTSDVVELEYGYRVPRQVYEFAARLLPFAAPAVNEPRVIRSGPADPELLEHDADDLGSGAAAAASAHAGRGAFVGIVCPARLRDELARALKRRSIQWADGDSGLKANLNSINVVSPETAKGLEFDAVVVVEPEEIVASDPHGLRLLYIALTRTTSHLSVVHSGRAMPIPEPSRWGDPIAEAATPVTEIAPSGVTLTAPGPQSPGSEAPTASQDFADAPAPALSATPPAPPPVATPTAPAAKPNRVLAPDVPAPAASPALTPGAPVPAAAAPTQPSASGPAPTAPSFDLSSAVVAAAVGSVAGEVRRAVPAEHWPKLIDQLRKELGITDEQLFEMLE